MRRALLPLATLLLLALPLAIGQQPQELGMVHVGHIDGRYQYLPARVDVFGGAPVQLMTFEDPSDHAIVSDTGAWPDALAVSNGTAGFAGFTAPTVPGDYPFHCSVHPEMRGVLVVHARPASGPGDEAVREAPAPAGLLSLAALVLGALVLGRKR